MNKKQMPPKATGGGGGGGMRAGSMASARFSGTGIRRVSAPLTSRFVSTSGSFGHFPFAYRNRYFNNFVVYPYPSLYYNYATVPYAVAPIYAPLTNYSVGNPLTYFGSCQAADGVGVVNQSCAPGLVAIPQAGNTCTCYDRTSGVSGCANVAGATCSPYVPSPYL
jgi:hypothetical protein